MYKSFFIAGSLFGLFAVVLGAFGAHVLTPHLPADDMSTFQTGNEYHFYHTFALFISAFLFTKYKSSLFKFSGYAFILGIILFSGSLYLLATETLSGIPVAFLGPVTPLGGVSFIAGWFLLMLGVIKTNN